MHKGFPGLFPILKIRLQAVGGCDSIRLHIETIRKKEEPGRGVREDITEEKGEETHHDP